MKYKIYDHQRLRPILNILIKEIFDRLISTSSTITISCTEDWIIIEGNIHK
jgi:hypothetical protein